MENESSVIKNTLTTTSSNLHEQATTIEEVISQLEAIINNSMETNDRMGYFAALYYKVTTRVQQGIKNNEFENGQRMERLDVMFANRFLEAMSQRKNKEQPTAAWLIAFNAAKSSSPLVFQHLMLGINAHINLDLGIATVQTAGNEDLKTIRQDFDSINNIIGALIFEVLNDLNRVSPLLSLFGLHASNNSILIQFSISNARDGAWSFAEELYSKKGNDYNACIASRDKTVDQLGVSLLRPTGLLKFTRWIIHIFEWKVPRKIINVFHQHKKKYISLS